jgi:hypothetical protein
MANRQLTEKLIASHKKHGAQVLEQFDGLLEAKSVKPDDICLVTCIEHDFGPNWRDRVMNMPNEAMEAIVTSGMFNKMAQRMIRHSLRENPKEEYKLSNLVPAETRGECEESFKDFGVFSDMEWHEVCELEAPPLYGLASDYLEHPNGKAGGLGMAVTREAMCKDPNGYIMAHIPKIRDAHDQRREDLLLDALIGYNVTYNRSGTQYDIYYDAGSGTPFDDGSGGPWVNAEALTITCPDDFQAIKELWREMTDLYHGRPIIMNTEGLNVMTSEQEADRLRKLLQSTSVEQDVTCGDASTVKYVMTPGVANGITFSPTTYLRLADRIAMRYDISIADARQWIWMGRLNEFLGFVYQIRPEVERLTLSADDQARRIVARYNSHSKGYAYIKDPMKGIILTGGASDSE